MRIRHTKKIFQKPSLTLSGYLVPILGITLCGFCIAYKMRDNSPETIDKKKFLNETNDVNQKMNYITTIIWKKLFDINEKYFKNKNNKE